MSARNKGLCPHLKYHAFDAWMFIVEDFPAAGNIFQPLDVYRVATCSEPEDFHKNLQTEIALPGKTVYNVLNFGIMSTDLQNTDMWVSCCQVS